MNKQLPNISFSVETEKNSALSFLDIEIYRENGKLLTSTYRKETFIGVQKYFTKILQILFLPILELFKFHIELTKTLKCLPTEIYR